MVVLFLVSESFEALSVAYAMAVSKLSATYVAIAGEKLNLKVAYCMESSIVVG